MRTIERIEDGYGRGDMAFRIVDGLEALAQRIRMRLLFWSGTWFADTREGVPYIAEPIVGRVVDPALAAQAISEQIRGVEGVVEVRDVSYVHDGASRDYRYAATVDSVFGVILIDELVGTELFPRALAYDIDDRAVPAAPTNLMAMALGFDRIHLTWDVVDDGRVPIERMELRIDNAAWVAIPDSGRGAQNHTMYTVGGLVPHRFYTFSVRAVNALGAGPAASVTASTALRLGDFNLPVGASFIFGARIRRGP